MQGFAVKIMKVSVVVPTYNSWKTLRDCIKSLLSQSLKPIEIVVVDNASSDGTKQKVTVHFPLVKIVSMKSNTGVTGGRNAGINVVSKYSDCIFFFDHDMVADKNMLEELVKIGESDEKIGIVTPKIYYFGGKKRIWSAGTGINLWTGRVLFRGGEDRGQYDEVCEVQVAPAAMLVKKKVVEKLKYFDDRYFATYEDTDYCFRAKKSGYKVYYAPRAIAYHKLSIDPKNEADRLLSRAYWVGRNRVLFMKDFGRSFLIFLLFVPIYIIHYLYLSLKFDRPKDGLKFIEGTVAGIFS